MNEESGAEWTLDIPCWILSVQKENVKGWPGSNQGNMPTGCYPRYTVCERRCK